MHFHLERSRSTGHLLETQHNHSTRLFVIIMFVSCSAGFYEYNELLCVFCELPTRCRILLADISDRAAAELTVSGGENGQCWPLRADPISGTASISCPSIYQTESMLEIGASGAPQWARAVSQTVWHRLFRHFDIFTTSSHWYKEQLDTQAIQDGQRALGFSKPLTG